MPLTLFVHAVLVGQDPDRLRARSLLAGTSGAAAAQGRAAGRRPACRRPDPGPAAGRRWKDGGEPGQPLHPRHQRGLMIGPPHPVPLSA
jgi:AI-2 transport protein TqsA